MRRAADRVTMRRASRTRRRPPRMLLRHRGSGFRKLAEQDRRHGRADAGDGRGPARPGRQRRPRRDKPGGLSVETVEAGGRARSCPRSPASDQTRRRRGPGLSGLAHRDQLPAVRHQIRKPRLPGGGWRRHLRRQSPAGPGQQRAIGSVGPGGHPAASGACAGPSRVRPRAKAIARATRAAICGVSQPRVAATPKGALPPISAAHGAVPAGLFSSRGIRPAQRS